MWGRTDGGKPPRTDRWRRQRLLAAVGTTPKVVSTRPLTSFAPRALRVRCSFWVDTGRPSRGRLDGPSHSVHVYTRPRGSHFRRGPHWRRGEKPGLDAYHPRPEPWDRGPNSRRWRPSIPNPRTIKHSPRRLLHNVAAHGVWEEPLAVLRPAQSGGISQIRFGLLKATCRKRKKKS